MTPLESLQHKIDALRNRGYGGTPIKQHRALYHIAIHKGDILIALLLPLVFNIALLYFIDEIINGWRLVFEFWLARIEPGASVATREIDLGSYALLLPYPNLSAGTPDGRLWWGTLIGCALTYLATYLIPPARFLPLTYILRACLLIQFSALGYFMLMPGDFPYGLQDHVTDALTMSFFFLLMMPWIFGITYYIFNFPLLQKFSITFITLAYFLLVLPMQYLFHAYALHHVSLLFLPVFYLVFGIFLDIMMFVSFYSWGMSWRWRKIRQERW